MFGTVQIQPIPEPVITKKDNQLDLKFRNAQRGDKSMIVDLDADITKIKGNYIKLLKDPQVNLSDIRFFTLGKEMKSGQI